MKLFISEPEERHQGAILVHDEALNDIAEFYHNEHATVETSYETALALAKKLTCDDAQAVTEAKQLADLFASADTIGYLLGGSDRWVDLTNDEADLLIASLRALAAQPPAAPVDPVVATIRRCHELLDAVEAAQSRSSADPAAPVEKIVQDLGDAGVYTITKYGSASPQSSAEPAAPVEKSGIMLAAENAAKVVEGWSDSKRAYAERMSGTPLPNSSAETDSVKIQRIQQRGDNDCGIAAIAMACGVPYDEVLPLMRRGSGAGINEIDLQDWLRENGWAWQIVYRNMRRSGRYETREPWPPKPWAPSHIAQVVTPTAYHFTVMDSAGEVFDSWKAARKSLTDLDYREVSWVMGLWKIADRSASLSADLPQTPSDSTVNELAAWLIALEDASMYEPVPDSLIDHGRIYIHAGLTEKHSGDCTNESHSCVVCGASDAIAKAKQILAALALSRPHHSSNQEKDHG